MKIRLPLISATALATLAACGSNNQANNAVDVNATTSTTEMNQTVTNATDLNATDMNATDLNAGGSADNSTANASGNSY